MGKSRASKLNGYRSAVSRQTNDVYKFKTKRAKKKQCKTRLRMRNKSVPKNDFFEKISDILSLPQGGGDNMAIIVTDPQYIVAIAFAIGTLVKMLRK